MGYNMEQTKNGSREIEFKDDGRIYISEMLFNKIVFDAEQKIANSGKEWLRTRMPKITTIQVA